MPAEDGQHWCQFHGVIETLGPLDFALCDHCGHVWQSEGAWQRAMAKARERDGKRCPLCRMRRVIQVGKGTDMEIEERQRRWHVEMMAAKDYKDLAENSIARAVAAIPARSAVNGPVVDTSEVDSLQAEAGVYAAMASMHYAAATAFGSFPS